MRKYGYLINVLILTIIFTACGNVEPTPSPIPPTIAPTSDFPISVIDGVGNRVIIEAIPERIVSLAPAHTETLFALGLAERVVGVTEYCNYPPEVLEKTKVGGFSNIDLEQVVGLDPDLVLATTMHMAEIVPALQEREITVFVADPQTVMAVLETTLTIGHITGQDFEADELVGSLQTRIDAVKDALKDTPSPRVFWELGPELYTTGPGTFVDDLISMAGGTNIAAEADTPWPQLSVEAIVLQDPDIVVLADHNYGENASMLQNRPGWQDISAIKKGNIVEITNDDIVSRPGPRVAEGLEFLAKAFHPDLFK